MKHLLTTAALLAIVATPVLAQNGALWMERANAFYEQSAFDSAAAYYHKVIESGVNNSAVYFNLGNAYYRLNKIGMAILYYEKARALSPGDPDIAANIRFANLNIEDRVPEPQRGFLEALVWRLHTSLSLGTQLWVLVALLMALGILFSVGLFASRNVRLWFVYLSSLLVVVVLVVGASAGYKIYQSEKVTYAVVLERTVDAKNQPNGSTVLFTAHEGTKFRIRKQLDAWLLVSLPNGVSGWVETSVLGRI